MSASQTAAWNNINAVKDGAQVFTGDRNADVWATWSPDRPAQQWLQYEWSESRTLHKASIAFWSNNASDTAGNDVTVPRAWKLQAWVDGAWTDVVLQGDATYPREREAANTVTFAAPVETTRLRALFEATTDGQTFAAVGVSEFEVEGDPTRTDGTEWLSSDSFTVGVSRLTGGLYNLVNASDTKYCTNFVANPQVRPEFDVDDSRWTGDVVLRADGRDQVTGLSDDTREVSRDGDAITVTYDSPSANPNGVRSVSLEERYELTGADDEILDWSLKLGNPSAAPVEVEDLGLPLLMNAWWDGGNQTGIYEQNVSRHSFVAEDGSYMFWQRPNGEGPYLVMVPKDGTTLEFKDKVRKGEGVFGERTPSFEGLPTYFIHSSHVGPTRVAAERAAQYLPASSVTLAPGNEQSYGFEFRWADDYTDLRDVLFDAGVVDVVSLPGMTIPQDTKATLAVRARDGIESVTPGGGLGSAGDDARIAPTGERNGYELYEIEFPTLGENFVTVTYAGGKTSVLQYYSIEPIESLIEANASFITENQQAREPQRGYDGAYLQWDMRSQQQVTRYNLNETAIAGIPEFELRWMTGGSDDIGLSPAAFVAEKNVTDPDAAEVASLDYYIDNFLLGYLQNQFQNGERTWNLYHWYDGGDGDRPATGRDDGTSPDVGDGLATWRVMNSPHVWNTYWGMYRIAEAHPDLAERPAAEYLDMAYRTMKAYFEHDDARLYLPDASRHLASMGELTMPLIEDALRAAGRTAEADTLRGFFAEKYEHFASLKYPFASEMSIDTTAFEANYTLSNMFGDEDLARKVTLASLAARGNQPLWYYYGGDNRHMGESWWNLGYETQLGAWQQQEYLLNHDLGAAGIDASELARSTYGAYYAGWANINSGQISADPANIGAASWQFQSQKGSTEYGWIPNIDGWWSWSGESALGFWGALNTASVNVVDDSAVGLYAYGGDVEAQASGWRITPKDGVRQRLVITPAGKLGVSLENAKYSSATVAADLSSIELALDKPEIAGATPEVIVTNLPAGRYVVRDGDDVVSTVDAAALSAGVQIEPRDSGRTLSITREQAGADVQPGKPSISGAAAVGETLTARAGDWQPSDATFSYQWLRDGAPIGGAESATYVVTSADRGHSLSVRVVGRSATGAEASATSDSVAVPSGDAAAPSVQPQPAGGSGDRPRDASKLANTGGEGGWIAAMAVIAALLLGAGALLRKRRRDSVISSR
ncbi:DUF5695 domain-containing protein [Microbacterium radiodurans]|uniref:LPXTG cell wall anchor domain-containing protein n=1 Tax=Microbacterium radiodurans TaxID=661398 RepID=A0A5J5IMM3_9MICO|nr:DUF5695 domain-containing protein [Microbacterium radiodurans]KAA9083739.1 LPXTG cell wall anchor domain-containing protein [Microbacterium radiodurans]